MECFRWFANRLFVWSAKFVSHAILLETKTLPNGDNLNIRSFKHAKLRKNRFWHRVKLKPDIEIFLGVVIFGAYPYYVGRGSENIPL